MSLPLIEAILLEIHQSLGCNSYPTVKKNKFASGLDSLSAHNTMGEEVLKDIFSALAMDPQACIDVTTNLMEFANAYKYLELNLWTFDADRRQILWTLLGYFLMPGLARRAALWSIEAPLDEGMPGGRFWYLPEIREKNGASSMYLPVAQVVDWLLDLLGLPVEQFADLHSESMAEEQSDLRRSLYNWRSGTTIRVGTIEKHFGDQIALQFKGAFTPDFHRLPTELFYDALTFVTRRQLTADQLRFEIPMTEPGRLEAILNHSSDPTDQARFVQCLTERYAPPSMETIRQRLLLAHAVQDGYERLLKLLCPGVDPKSTDPEQNKLLQLSAIYKYVYNMTIGASKHCRDQGEVAENQWFEDKLPPWDAHGLYLSILPSQRETANIALAELLTGRFSEMKPGDPLEDHVGLNGGSAALIIQRNIERMKLAAEEHRAEGELVERMKTASAWRTLQGENRYRVVARIAGRKDLGSKAVLATIQRSRELATTPSESLQAVLAELDGYLNNLDNKPPIGARDRVDALLAEAASNPSYALWEAPILQFRAKHLLACNDFTGAGKLLSEALEAARIRCYGKLRGEVARDCLALAVADHKLIPNNHEKYFKEILAGGMVESEEIPSIEEMGRWSSGYFWETLYRPYPEYEPIKRLASIATRKLLSELMEPLLTGDQNLMQLWIKANTKLLKAGLPDVEGNSVLMLLIKMRTRLLQVPGSPAAEILESWTLLLKLIAESAPKQLNISDLKNQTPLMLMAEAGDTLLVKTFLLAGADPDSQDWQGMTALHSAIKSRVDGCVDALLENPCDLNQVTSDGQSPLHTAAWTGNLHAIRRLLHLAPELAWRRNSQRMTPLERIEYLIENPASHQRLLDKVGRQNTRCGTREELLVAVSSLENATAKSH